MPGIQLDSLKYHLRSPLLVRHFAVLEQSLEVLGPDMQVFGGFFQFKIAMWHNQSPSVY